MDKKDIEEDLDTKKINKLSIGRADIEKVGGQLIRR